MKRIALTLLAGLAVSAPVFADELALATSKNCMACHAVDKKLVGPAYKDVAAKVIKGGSGVWGQVPMPPNAQVNDAEAKKLVTWVLSIK